jgi:hypothetical protein
VRIVPGFYRPQEKEIWLFFLAGASFVCGLVAIDRSIEQERWLRFNVSILALNSLPAIRRSP